MDKNKKPNNKYKPTIKKEPRIEPIRSSINETPSWQFNRLDLNGRWGCSEINKETLIETILPKLEDFESMEWSNIDGKTGSHDIPVGDICKEAKKRLEEIEQDDTEKIYSLRLTGKKRIWGIKDGRILKIIWWDPNHEICPSLK